MGYKSEQFVKKVDENLICSICQEVFKDPVGCKDGHTFCSDCITDWLRTTKTCPLDQGYLEENNLVRLLNLRGIIDNLDVYCHPPVAPSDGARSNQTCGWTGKLQDLDKHRKTCPFQQVKCPHVNCNKTMQRREMEEHDEECQLKMIKCKGCEKDLIRQELEKHNKDECPETLILCPNNCTSTQEERTEIKRIDLNRHLTNCARAVVDCPFKEQGCLVQVERQHVDKHVQENIATHMMLLAKQCSSLTKENKLLKDELNKVKENLNDQQLSRYTWKISDYFSLAMRLPNDSYFCSPNFWLCGYEWYLQIYPNGDIDETEGFLSVYLFLSDNQLVPLDSGISVYYRVKVLSQTPGKDDVSKLATDVFSKTKDKSGWTKFMDTADALSPPYCNSTSCSLTIQCTIHCKGVAAAVKWWGLKKKED